MLFHNGKSYPDIRARSSYFAELKVGCKLSFGRGGRHKSYCKRSID